MWGQRCPWDLCVSFACNNRLENYIESYKKNFLKRQETKDVLIRITVNPELLKYRSNKKIFTGPESLYFPCVHSKVTHLLHFPCAKQSYVGI